MLGAHYPIPTEWPKLAHSRQFSPFSPSVCSESTWSLALVRVYGNSGVNTDAPICSDHTIIGLATDELGLSVPPSHRTSTGHLASVAIYQFAMPGYTHIIYIYIIVHVDPGTCIDTRITPYTKQMQVTVNLSKVPLFVYKPPSST